LVSNLGYACAQNDGRVHFFRRKKMGEQVKMTMRACDQTQARRVLRPSRPKMSGTRTDASGRDMGLLRRTFFSTHYFVCAKLYVLALAVL
jgi:hypothetical protein